jgi:DNA (cytosine-5)-methyltransferase 1
MKVQDQHQIKPNAQSCQTSVSTCTGLKRKRVLNLYAGIGGNRKDWNDDLYEVTAIEFNEEIANIYKDLHPNDTVIVADAHEYLAKHYREFDIIWSSPPCQSHSKVRMMASKSGSYDAVMPDMKLWSEIIFLQNFTKNTDIKFVVENVKPYYEPFVKPTAKLGRHLFWANFEIPETEIKDGLTHNERGSSEKGYFDLREYKIKHRKDQIIRNCVDPNVGQYVLGCAVS